MQRNFNEFRFKGLDYKSCSNNYFTMKRGRDDEEKIVRTHDVKLGCTSCGLNDNEIEDLLDDFDEYLCRKHLIKT